MKREFQIVFRMNLQLRNMKMTIWRNWNKGKCITHWVVGTEQVGVVVAILYISAGEKILCCTFFRH
jgi:hypothetical protein